MLLERLLRKGRRKGEERERKGRGKGEERERKGRRKGGERGKNIDYISIEVLKQRSLMRSLIRRKEVCACECVCVVCVRVCVYVLRYSV